jgi:beta-lactam-binding protein with PASTA domain
VSDDDDAEVVTSPSPTDTPFYKLSTDIVGDNFKVWEERLKKLGFEVSKEDEDTDEYEKDQIVTTDPEPGSELEEGQAVTLIVSTGKAPDEDENGKPDGPPGQEKKEDDD